ncbi:MAG: PEP-utilizing enzyme [Patescibacteria group bacterium]
MPNIPSAQNWRKIVSRGKYPLLFVHELNIGLLNTHRVTGFKTKLTSYARVKGASYLFEPEAQKFILQLRKVLQTDPKKALVWLDNYRAKVKDLFLWISKTDKLIKKIDLSQADLIRLHRQYTKKVETVWWWCYLPFLMDDAITLELSDLLIKLGWPKKELASAIAALTFNPKIALHQQEQAELLKLAAGIKKGGWKKHEKKITQHLYKWGWKNSWCYIQNPLSQNDLRNEIKILVGKNPGRVLIQLKKEQQKRQQVRNKILAQFKSKQLKILADVLAEYAFWHSYKMEEKTKSVYLAKPFLDSLAKSLDLSYWQLIELIPSEIWAKKINRKIIKERLKDSGILMLFGHWQVITGKRLTVLKNKIEKQPKNLKSLNGFVVYPGHAVGKAVFAEEGVNVLKVKINTGDILVTPMTTATMVPLIKKVAGIVTNEGGLLSHAAIIAREFKKPCVVGTQFATKIFKTGDLIKVDAINGIVRKIK